MPLISFAASRSLYEVFVGINKFCSSWFESINKFKRTDNLNLDKPNRFLCESLGSPCVPSCHLFSPIRQCGHSQLEIRQHSIADSALLYLSQRRDEKEYWELFYECFHPKPKDENEVGRTTLEFPDDLPNIPNAMIEQTAKASLKLQKDDPKYWTPQRLQWALGSDPVKKRIGRSDWYWSWYNKVLVPAGLEPSLKMLKAKHELDEVLSKKFDRNEVGNEEVLEVTTDDKIYPTVKRLLGVINENLTGLNLKVVKPEVSKSDNDEGNEQIASEVPTPVIVHHPAKPLDKPHPTDSNHTSPEG